MSILVIAEHDNQRLKPSTLSTLAAAQQIGGEIALLVAGNGCAGAAKAAAKAEGVSKVLLADNPAYDHELAENMAALIVSLADGYTHILAPATANGKNFMPRVAALLDDLQVKPIGVISLVGQDILGGEAVDHVTGQRHVVLLARALCNRKNLP